MRSSSLFAAISVLVGASALASAQDQNLAAPAANSEPIDDAARQAPWGRSDIDANRKDRLYSIGSSSNEVAVLDPTNSSVLGFIALEGPTNAIPTYATSIGYSPNGKIVAVASGRSSTIAFIDARRNAIIHTADVDGRPVGAFYTPNGKEIWIPVDAANYISVLKASTFEEVARVPTPDAPASMTFSNNGRYAYVCPVGGGRTAVFDVAKRSISAILPQGQAGCSSIAASPNGRQVWLTQPDAGKAVAFSTKPPFATLKTMDTGALTNTVNFVSNDDGQFAYVSVGSTGVVEVIDTDRFSTIATLSFTGAPQGLWPSGDGRLLYVGLGDAKSVGVIDTAAQTIRGSIRVGQSVASLTYVPSAVRSGPGTANLLTMQEIVP